MAFLQDAVYFGVDRAGRSPEVHVPQRGTALYAYFAVTRLRRRPASSTGRRLVEGRMETSFRTALGHRSLRQVPIRLRAWARQTASSMAAGVLKKALNYPDTPRTMGTDNGPRINFKSSR